MGGSYVTRQLETAWIRYAVSPAGESFLGLGGAHERHLRNIAYMYATHDIIIGVYRGSMSAWIPKQTQASRIPTE